MHLSEFIISSLVLLQTDFSKTSDGIHECLGSDTFTSNDSYEENLDKLTSFISQYTPDGFRNLSMADDNGQYKVYGSVLCFGNTSVGDCGGCVRKAIAQIRGLCPYNKAAVIWFGACHVKYSNNDFSGQIDNKVRCDVAPQNVKNPKSFYKWTKYLLNVLVVNASTLKTHYALETVRVSYWKVHKIMRWGNKKKDLHLVAQCTGDLSRCHCRKCLDYLMLELPTCSHGKT